MGALTLITKDYHNTTKTGEKNMKNKIDDGTIIKKA